MLMNYGLTITLSNCHPEQPESREAGSEGVAKDPDTLPFSIAAVALLYDKAAV